MSKQYDVLVVGAGLSGLLAALFAAIAGKSTLVITHGNGALTIGGGTIDVLGYAPSDNMSCKEACTRCKALLSPFDGLSCLGAEHPYTLAGEANVRAALNAFEKLSLEGGYPYTRDGESNTRVITSVGVTKPAYLVPQSMNMQGVGKAEQLVVAGFEGLKDFHPHLVSQGLARLKAFRGKKLTPLLLASPFGQSDSPQRDLSTLDLARYIETSPGERWLIDRLRRSLVSCDVLLLPPLLGLRPKTALHERMEQALGLHVYEVLTPPPAVTGLRLLSMLKTMLKNLQVDIIEQASVTRPVLVGGRCKGVVTTSSLREREYEARAVIMATGGIYGEGVTVLPDKTFETVFGLSLNSDLTPASPGWSSPKAFSADASHGFATLGVRVNNRFNPVDQDGKVLWDNVFFVGRSLGGYDHATEKSGNGVAVVTAFVAANIA